MVVSTEPVVSAPDQARQFLVDCARAMALCAESDETRDLVGRFNQQLACTTSREFEPQLLPALHSLDLVVDMKLALRFQQFAREMPWKQSSRTNDEGRDAALLDFGDVLDLDSMTAGMMYVDAHKTYPEHQHEREEIYFLVSGTACWLYGGNQEYQSLTAGNLIYNHSWDLHGVRAGHTPLLALYLL